MYRDLEHFYTDNLERRSSPEASYGVHWRLGAYPQPWRISYVQATGEVYAVHQDGNMGPLFLLGVVPADPVSGERRDLYYRTLERILDGWPEMCGKHGGMEWVRDRLKQEGYGMAKARR